MTTRWTEADIKRKGLKVSNSTPLKPPKSVELKQPPAFALGRMKQGKMNKTEAAYAKYLEVQKQFGHVMEYWFEPMNLRLADKCFFKVDFMVLTKNLQLECHEVKGWWTDDAKVKIKAAATKFPFRFIAVQLIKGNWVFTEF